MMATKKTRLGELGLMVQGIVEAETRLSAANLQSKVKRDFRAFGARIVSRQLSKDKTFLAPCDQDYFIEKLQIATKDKFAQLFNTVMINVKLKFNESAIAQFKSETSKQTRIIVEDAKIDYQRASIVTDIGRRWKSTFCHADFYNQVRTQLAMRLQPTDEDAVTLSLPEAAQTDLLFETTTTGASSTSTRLPLSNVANSLPASAPSRLPFENIDTIPPSNPLHLPLSNVADSADKLSFSSAQPQASVDWRQNISNSGVSEQEIAKELYLYYVVPQPGIAAAVLKLQDQVESLKTLLRDNSIAGESVAAISETIVELTGIVAITQHYLFIITSVNRPYVQQMGILHREI